MRPLPAVTLKRMPRPKKQPQALTVAVTGAAGYIASRLITHLGADDRVAKIIGFDTREPRVRDPKLIFDRIDIRNPAVANRLAGVDVLVHLAFVMDPIRDEAHMRDVNVNGSQNVLRAAGAQGVTKVVYTSSAVVYGAHPDNDVPLTESSSLRANLDLSYAAHKLEVEYVIKELTAEFPEMIVTVLRPAIVFGPHVDNAWSHLIEMPFVVGVKGHNPPFQFVHEDDVAAALAFAVLDKDLPGAYNLAPEGWLEADEVMSLTTRRRFDMDEVRAFSLVERLWSLGLAEAPAGLLHYVMHPWVLSPAKLQGAGFTCVRSSREALEETVAAGEGMIRLGRHRMKVGDLRRGAAAGLGLMGVATAYRRIRRRSAEPV